MARATAGYDGDLARSAGGIRAAEDDLVLGVQGQGWVCEGEGVECGQNQMVRIGEEVLGWEEMSDSRFLWVEQKASLRFAVDPRAAEMRG